MEPRLQHALDSFPPPMEVIKDDMYYENTVPTEYSTFNNNNLGEQIVSVVYLCALVNVVAQRSTVISIR